MKKAVIFSLAIFFILAACGQNISHKNNTAHIPVPDNRHGQIEVKGAATVRERFLVPKGFERTKADSSSFAGYLRNLPLKPGDELVKYYNGKTKPNNNIYAAVIDLPIGDRNLHQCADAIMRLRAEYFFEQHRYGDIHFNFTNGFKADYATWRKGNRIVVKGNKVYWTPKANATDSYASFWEYLEMVFGYAGTASLEKELDPVAIDQMKIGDVFIKGGFPGHAVIVIDMARNKATGETLFLLAQSYMPAQEIQILKNPNSELWSPWYGISEMDMELQTPEWIFANNRLRRFRDGH